MLIKSFIITVCLIECYISLGVKTSPYKSSRRRIIRILRSRMEQSGIVPDVIDTIPPNIVRVQYPSGVEVNLGNELTPTSVKDEPSVEWPVEEGSYYTLCMTDPDAPSRKEPTRREIKHWLVVNIPGTQISKGETLAGYRGSGPSLGSGLHRYIFLVYKQPGIIKHSEAMVSSLSREGRVNFKIRDFAKKYNLGEPIAANYYEAQYDDYVAILRSKTM